MSVTRRENARRASIRPWRRLVGFWRRWTRWEFWPRWLFYPPIVLWILALAVRHGGLSVFTTVNTAIWSGGVIGRSKARILEALGSTPEFVAQTCLIPPGITPDERCKRAMAFIAERKLGWPVVFKPDMGARGAGVAILSSQAEVLEYFQIHRGATIAQEYAPGDEFGVFYLRFPGDARGRIFSITEKRIATVVGDGRRTVEDLVFEHPRAVILASHYLETNRRRLGEVPSEGQVVRLGELGTHCQGAIFLDGNHLVTSDLETAIDRISQEPEGFFFGRYDLRAESIGDLRGGRRFKIVELNGLISEAAHIYDPRYSLLTAYKVLFKQWRLAAEIGRENARRGARPTPLLELVRLARRARDETSGGHAASMG